jgi:RNA recognition motif-containing protein
VLILFVSFRTENELLKCLYASAATLGSYSDCDVHVGRIPCSATNDHLRQLFPEATSIAYRQGTSTHNRSKLGYVANMRVGYCFLLLCLLNDRFAFLHFADIQSAARVIELAGQYRIDNKSLSVSYKLLK